MPTVPEGFDWDLDSPGSRFTDRAAFALGVPEAEWDERNASVEGRAALSRHIGDWVLEEQEELGQGEVVGSTYGRGASGIAVALEFVGLYALGGVISVSAGMAWKRLLHRVGVERQDDGRRGVLVSRGGAAYLAAAEVGERFGEEGDLVVEAVEEPSAIGGREVSELSYTGIEPWVVLLRRNETLHRYVVVVSAHGEVDGAIESPIREAEAHYLLPPPNIVRPPRRRRRWRFWRRGRPG